MQAKDLIGKAAFLAFMALPMLLVVMSGYAAISGAEGGKTGFMCWVLLALAAAVAFSNLYLAFLRPMLYARRHGGSLEGYKFVSGIPAVGTVMVAAAVVAGWGQMPVAVAGFVLLLGDVGGTVWLLVSIGRDRTFWTG